MASPAEAPLRFGGARGIDLLGSVAPDTSSDTDDVDLSDEALWFGGDNESPSPDRATTAAPLPPHPSTLPASRRGVHAHAQAHAQEGPYQPHPLPSNLNSSAHALPLGPGSAHPLPSRIVTHTQADAVATLPHWRGGFSSSSSTRPIGLSLVPRLVDSPSTSTAADRLATLGGDIIKGPTAALAPTRTPTLATSLAPSLAPTASVFIPRPLPSQFDAARAHPMRRASAPMNVPRWGKLSAPRESPLAAAAAAAAAAASGEAEAEAEGGERVTGVSALPPHEIVARQYAQSVTFSVTEGVGRALRGRDLSHVRTEILRKTGFFEG